MRLCVECSLLSLESVVMVVSRMKGSEVKSILVLCRSAESPRVLGSQFTSKI